MFGFPQVDHKNYNKNFLKTVIFQIVFQENLEIIKRKDELFELFHDTFPRTHENASSGVQVSFNPTEKTPILEPIKDSNLLVLRSNDGQKIISINSTSLIATFNGGVYVNFEQFKGELGTLNSFFKLFGIEVIRRVSIRKINLIEFKISGDASDILRYIIKPELLSDWNYFPSSESVKQNIQNVRYESGRNSLNLRYGLNVPPMNNSGLGQVILDIDLLSLEDIKVEDVFTRADLINNEIFNIFSWAISQNTIDLLNG